MISAFVSAISITKDKLHCFHIRYKLFFISHFGDLMKTTQEPLISCFQKLFKTASQIRVCLDWLAYLSLT